VFKQNDNGELVARDTEDEAGAALFQGRVDGPRVLWVRQSEESTQIRRTWIHGATLFIEEELVPHNPGQPGWIVSGQLARN
jgi:hypothetical protein